jgi:hypothetical protein
VSDAEQMIERLRGDKEAPHWALRFEAATMIANQQAEIVRLREYIMSAEPTDPDEAEAKAMCRMWGNNCPQFALACIQRGRELEQSEAVELLRQVHYMLPESGCRDAVDAFLARHDKGGVS